MVSQKTNLSPDASINTSVYSSCAIQDTPGALPSLPKSTSGMTLFYAILFLSLTSIVSSAFGGIKEPTASQMAAGRHHNCALLKQDSLVIVKCWGRNEFGQLGLGDTDNRGDADNEMGNDLPAVNLGSNVRPLSITAGSNHTCAMLQQGARRVVKCWGRNEFGQLGLGDMDNRGDDANEMGNDLPAVNLGSDVRPLSITASGNSTCALLKQGLSKITKCWGNNRFGQLGQGDTNNRGDTPNEMGDALPAIDLGKNVKLLSVYNGAIHACALLKQGEEEMIKCWGDNYFAQLGLGIPAEGNGDCSDSPNNCRGDDPDEMGDNLSAIDLGKNAKLLAKTFESSGEYHNCVSLKQGPFKSLKCWGWNLSGQLGIGLLPDDFEPLPPPPFCTKNVNNCWGDKPGEMGDNLPAVNLGENVEVLSTSGGGSHRHMCALLKTQGPANGVKCWGWNNYGLLGLGLPAEGAFAPCSINPNNCRGDDPDQMGDNLPYVNLGSDVQPLSISAGFTHTCALLKQGLQSIVKCWGRNEFGQLGLGDTNNRGGDPKDMGDQLPAVDLGTVEKPVLSLEANNSNQNIIIAHGTNLTVNVSLISGAKEGDISDYWVYVKTPFGYYWYTLDQGWIRSDIPIRIYSGAIFDLTKYNIFNGLSLPVGVYTFYFVVDDDLLDERYESSIKVTIE